MTSIACEKFVGPRDADHATTMQQSLAFIADAIALIESGRTQQGIELLRRCHFEIDNTLTWVSRGAPFPKILMRYPLPEVQQ